MKVSRLARKCDLLLERLTEPALASRTSSKGSQPRSASSSPSRTSTRQSRPRGLPLVARPTLTLTRLSHLLRLIQPRSLDSARDARDRAGPQVLPARWRRARRAHRQGRRSGPPDQQRRRAFQSSDSLYLPSVLAPWMVSAFECPTCRAPSLSALTCPPLLLRRRSPFSRSNVATKDQAGPSDAHRPVPVARSRV